MRTRISLGLEDARRLVEAARETAISMSLEISIAIVDEAGVLLLLERLDGARLHTPEVATLKARSAAIFRTPTATLQQQVRDNPAQLSFPGRVPVTGGMPLLIDGAVVGGVGSSGAKPEEDEAVCHAAIAALAAIAPATPQSSQSS